MRRCKPRRNSQGKEAVKGDIFNYGRRIRRVIIEDDKADHLLNNTFNSL